jgi:hypothetical protein
MSALQALRAHGAGQSAGVCVGVIVAILMVIFIIADRVAFAAIYSRAPRSFKGV